MTHAPLNTRRLALLMDPSQIRAMKAIGEHLKYSRLEMFASMLQLVVCKDTHIRTPTLIPALDLVRHPFESSHYWLLAADKLPRADAHFAEDTERWMIDPSLEFWHIFYECSEGIRPAHNMNVPRLNARVEKGGEFDGAHIGPVPRNRDEYTRLLDQTGTIPVQPGGRKRERGFGFYQKVGSNAMHPFAKALVMHTFSTGGRIPAQRAIMLACWTERLCNYWYGDPEFKPQSYDEKWHDVNQLIHARGDNRGAQFGLITPQECLQANTPELSAGHYMWGWVAPRWKQV